MEDERLDYFNMNEVIDEISNEELEMATGAGEGEWYRTITKKCPSSLFTCC
ncbi:hypothetical protein CIW83_05340 [Tissierella sp. P1]|uniref:Type A2 lanthipeptide n=1 Tax=Tissierella carlieri TaxID=689904 RepID=A0ABT1SFW0_9FIRM|nr:MULTISPECIES: type A2 lanthipeptide [Tissierella]MCQ4925155.1 type A2 lanthipeptide [Tissierella carlieri]OZV13298.1 hypothetical protein CIW83_05340 [Tissierella sp. P1]